MTSQQPYIVPKLTESTRATDFVLDSYLLHIHRAHCSHCNGDTLHSQLFEVWILPSRHSGVTPSRNLRPQEGPLRHDLAIGISRLPPKHCRVCHLCVDSLQAPTPTQYDSEAAWRDTLRRKYSAEETIARQPTRQPTRQAERQSEPKSPPKAPTLDQL